jgi:phosphosulfolactate synthase
LTITPDWITSQPKPRDARRTQILDKGLGQRGVRDIVEVSGDLIDLAKLGWGTALVTNGLSEKIDIYKSAGISVCLGGTLLEVYNQRGEVERFEELVDALGLEDVEVSDGAIGLPLDEKAALISRFAEKYTVYSEVGQKDPEAVVTPAKWVHAILAELDAGATKVILEGRESGTAGMYRTSGEIRMGLIDEILDAGIPPEKLIFEAPTKASQTWFIKHVGVDVNLANVSPEDAISVETLRLGLRADTMADFHIS